MASIAATHTTTQRRPQTAFCIRLHAPSASFSMDPWMPSTVCAIFIMCLISRHSRWCRENENQQMQQTTIIRHGHNSLEDTTPRHRCAITHATPHGSVHKTSRHHVIEERPFLYRGACTGAHAQLRTTRGQGIAKCWSLTRIVMATSVCPSSIAVINAVSPVYKPAPPHTYIHLKNRGSQMARVPHTRALQRRGARWHAKTTTRSDLPGHGRNMNRNHKAGVASCSHTTTPPHTAWHVHWSPCLHMLRSATRTRRSPADPSVRRCAGRTDPTAPCNPRNQTRPN